MAVRVLVTGVSGFIGGHVVEHLFGLDGRYVVTGLARGSSVVSESTSRACSGGVRRCELPDDDFELMRAAVRQVDVVVHLAADMDFFPRDAAAEQRLRRVNVDGTRLLIDACVAEGVRRFVYCSSTEAQGASDPSGAKSSEAWPAAPTSVYGASKLEAEQACRDCRWLYPQLELIVLRLTGVYGPRDTFSIFELMHNVNNGLLFFIPGHGQALLMYTHVDDVCRAVRCAVDVDYRRVEASPHTPACLYNVCPDQPLTYQRWIELLSALLGRARPRLFLPLPLVRAVTALVAPVMNAGKRRTFMWQPQTIDRMAEHRNYDNARAKQELGFTPLHTIESGLAQVVDYNFKNGLINRYYLAPAALFTIVAAALVFYISYVLRSLFR